MDKAVLFIDGENFLHKVKDVLKKEDIRIKKNDLSKINLNFLLEKQGFEFLIAGNVRGQKVTVDGKTKIIFREKGVDVKIAVDLVSMAADKIIKTAILCSSDSDLQLYTTDATVVFRDAEILKACGID